VIDGKRSVADIIGHLAEPGSSSRPPLEHARSLFERLWWYDQVVFDTSRASHR
jgi:hypothetical protein